MKTLISGGILALAAFLSLSGQVMAQSRPDLMFCGSSGATGSELYSGIGALNEVSGCTPNSDTQALLVTRDGTLAGNGADWLAYLDAGGIIITEFQEPEDVHNEIYGTAYTSEFVGDCQDNVMPSTILNPGDSFWQANPLTEVGPTVDSCGSDVQDIVSGEVDVIALGARSDGSVSLAYRVQGSGVLFLSGADWQDGEAAYTADSEALFGAMIVARGITSGPPAPPPAPTMPVPVLPLWGFAALIAGLGLLGYRRLGRSRSA